MKINDYADLFFNAFTNTFQCQDGENVEASSDNVYPTINVSVVIKDISDGRIEYATTIPLSMCVDTVSADGAAFGELLRKKVNSIRASLV